MKKLFSILPVLIILLGCGQSPTEKQNTDPSSPKSRLERAKQSYNRKDLNTAEKELADLVFLFSSSVEANEGKELLKTVRQELATEKAKTDSIKAALSAVAIKEMVVNEDKIDNKTYYSDKNLISYKRWRAIYTYVVVNDDGEPHLGLIISHSDSDWLFIDRFTIKADGETFDIIGNRNSEVNQEVEGYGVREWIEREVTGGVEYRMIKAVMNSKEAIIRCRGSKGYNDRTITQEEKTAMKNVWQMFTALGGKI